MNEMAIDRQRRRTWLIRAAAIPVLALYNLAINLFGLAMLRAQGRRQPPPPPLLDHFLMGLFPAIAIVVLSIPVQSATRLLARSRIAIAIPAHIVLAAGFVVSHSTLTTVLRAAAGFGPPEIPLTDLALRHIQAFLPLNLLVYSALVAGTLAWDNWRLSVRRERTAARLAAELTRAELAGLRSRMQPHFLFNALHGISSVMDTDVALARRMMVSLSHLLRSSLSAGTEHASVEQEVGLTRDYLELQHMRFEDRLQYQLQVEADPHVRVPSFILQPLVENAVIHGMADRSEPTWIHVAVRQHGGEVEIDVSDNGPGFPDDILEGTKALGVGLGALRGRLLSMTPRGKLTLQNRPGGGAQVILSVRVHEEGGSNA